MTIPIILPMEYLFSLSAPWNYIFNSIFTTGKIIYYFVHTFVYIKFLHGMYSLLLIVWYVHIFGLNLNNLLCCCLFLMAINNFNAIIITRFMCRIYTLISVKKKNPKTMQFVLHRFIPRHMINF